MPEIFKEKIIKLLKHADYEPQKLTQLARTLGVKTENYPQFKEALEQLRQAGHIVIGVKNLISLPAMTGQIVGTFRANPSGFGFVVPNEANAYGDLFIPPDATGDAMTGDVVIAKVKRKGKRGRTERCVGEIVEILERAQNRLVGTLQKHPEGWLVQPDGKSFFEPISVDDVTAKNAREKDKVVVEIISWPSEKYLARGVIIEVLGKAGRYDTEIRAVIYRYHLPGDFDGDCIKQARQAAAEYNPDRLMHRQDITDKVVITIDPPDAKDFDDAISLEKDAKGNWILGVHIADVSHFIPADSPLDIEAKNRGNSVYLPGRTIPMLPEILSNGVCSLQPGQKRLVKSAYITYDKDAKIIGRSFADSVICSAQRLTYQQADGILKGHKKGFPEAVIELLKNMQTLSRAIEQRRFDAGMLHLDLPETELILDKSGRVIDAVPADTSYPHTIIEMFMVEANEAVASFLDKFNIPFMRRIHPEPDALSMQNLARLVRAFGYTLPRNPDRKVLQDLLESAKDADNCIAVNLSVLRSLERARYSPLNIGHYALASDCYCHFTSPIRRYADLLIHRNLDVCMKKDAASAKAEFISQDLTEIGKHISFTEQQAQNAEDDLKTVLILQMLQDKIGEQLDCVVTGLTGYGIFLQCRKFGVDGLIRLNELGQDIWRYDEKSHSVTGQNSGGSIRLGQAFKARIVSINIPARQLNLAPVNLQIKSTGRRSRKSAETKQKKKRRHR
jgi:ribonuclease R